MQDTVCMPEPENQGWVDGITCYADDHAVHGPMALYLHPVSAPRRVAI